MDRTGEVIDLGNTRERPLHANCEACGAAREEWAGPSFSACAGIWLGPPVVRERRAVAGYSPGAPPRPLVETFMSAPLGLRSMGRLRLWWTTRTESLSGERPPPARRRSASEDGRRGRLARAPHPVRR